MPYHVYKEFVQLYGVVFKSKPIKIKDSKVKPKRRSQEWKISEISSTAIMQKQQNYRPQNQS